MYRYNYHIMTSKTFAVALCLMILQKHIINITCIWIFGSSKMLIAIITQSKQKYWKSRRESWLKSYTFLIGMNESYCPAPPLVENARLLSSDKDWGVGTTALYSCEKGFYITGLSELVCVDDNGVVDWLGELPECRMLGTANICMTITFLNFHVLQVFLNITTAATPL